MRNRITQSMVIFILLLPAVSVVYKTNYPQARAMVEANWALSLTGGDQNGIYQSFKIAFEGKVPPGIDNGWIAVGYLSLLGFYHKLSPAWTTPSIEASFVYHGVFYSVLAAILCIFLSYRVAKDFNMQGNRVTLAFFCSAFWYSALKLSSVLSFSWLPWSHYAAAFVGIAFLFSLYETVVRPKKRNIFLVAFFGTLFLFSRRHEAIAVFLACGITFSFWVVLFVLRKRKFSVAYKSFVAPLSFCALGVVIAIKFISFFSNGMPLNSHYAQQRQSNSYLNEYLKVYPQMIPVRFVQTFFDPNFYSYGSQYTPRAIYNVLYESKDFAMPMIFQLPILWYLLPLLFSLFLFLANQLRLGKLDFPPVVFLFIAGGLGFLVLVCGYLATAVWGGVHLRNGLIREFILATLLLMVACGPGITIYLGNQVKKPKLGWGIPLFGIWLLAFVVGQKIVPNMNWAGFVSKHVSSTSTSHYECAAGKCKVSLDFKFESGEQFEPPFEHAIVNLNCPNGIEGLPLAQGESGITKFGPDFEFDVVNCKSPVKIEVYPLFTGYCGSGQPYLKFSACSSQGLANNCDDRLLEKL